MAERYHSIHLNQRSGTRILCQRARPRWDRREVQPPEWRDGDQLLKDISLDEYKSRANHMNKIYEWIEESKHQCQSTLIDAKNVTHIKS